MNFLNVLVIVSVTEEGIKLICDLINQLISRLKIKLTTNEIYTIIQISEREIVTHELQKCRSDVGLEVDWSVVHTTGTLSRLLTLIHSPLMKSSSASMYSS